MTCHEITGTNDNEVTTIQAKGEGLHIYHSVFSLCVWWVDCDSHGSNYSYMSYLGHLCFKDNSCKSEDKIIIVGYYHNKV